MRSCTKPHNKSHPGALHASPLVKVVAIVLVTLLCAGCAPEIVRSTIPFVQKTGSDEVIQLSKSTTVPNYSGAGNTLFVAHAGNTSAMFRTAKSIVRGIRCFSCVAPIPTRPIS